MAADSVAAYKRLSLRELMDLEVTSVSRRREKLSDAASAIQAVTGEEIRRSGASTLPQALRLVDNLNIAQKNAHDWAISARGFNTALANKLLVLVDGRSVYTPLFSGVFWSLQEPFLADLDRIEVISGPGASVWGANAVNGVISVISKRASETQGLYVELGAGDRLAGSVAVRYGGELGEHAHYRVHGKYFDREEERLAVSGAGAGDPWHRGAGGFRIDVDRGTTDRWTLQGDAYEGSDGIVTGGESRVGGENLLGRFVRTFADGSDLAVRTYFDRARLRQSVPALFFGTLPLAPAGELRDELDTLDFDYEQRSRILVRHGLTWGMGYRHWRDSIEAAPSLGFLPTKRSHDLWSAFVQDEIALTPRLGMVLGTKIEHDDYTGWEFEPTVRLEWHPADDFMFWAAASRAVRTPSRIDRDLRQPSAGALVLLAGNPDFESESVIAWELGHRLRIGATATGSISTFYNEYRDVRSTRLTPGTILPLVFANDVEGETYGLEVTVRVQPIEHWSLHLGYALLEENLRIRPGGADLNAARNEIADPEQQATLRSLIALPHAVELHTALRWVDALRINAGATVGRVPSYVELDLSLGWQATPEVGLTLVGQNLLHDRHPEYGFPNPQQVEIQRSVLAKLTWRRP